VARMGKRKGSYRFLVDKLEVRRATRRASHRWEDNIKMKSFGMARNGLICLRIGTSGKKEFRFYRMQGI